MKVKTIKKFQLLHNVAPTCTKNEPSKSHHRKKKWSHQFKGSPFPVPIASLTESTAAPNAWFYFLGELKNDHVVVNKSGDISYLYKMGFFGRGLLSRGGPNFFKNLPKVHLPGGRGDAESISVMERRMYLRHCRWQKSHDQPSANENDLPEDQEFDSDVEYPDDMVYPAEMQPYGEVGSFLGSCDEKEDFDRSHEKGVTSDGEKLRGIALGEDSGDMENGEVWEDNDVDEEFWTGSKENCNAENNEDNADNQSSLKTAKENDWEAMDADADFWGVEAKDNKSESSVGKVENKNFDCDRTGSGLKRYVQTENSDDHSQKRVKISDDCDDCLPFHDNGENIETSLKCDGETCSRSVTIEGRSVSLTFESRSDLNTVGGCKDNDSASVSCQTLVEKRVNLCENTSNSEDVINKPQISHEGYCTLHSCGGNLKENQEQAGNSSQFSRSKLSESDECNTKNVEKEEIADEDKNEDNNQRLVGKAEESTSGSVKRNDEGGTMDDDNHDNEGDINDIGADDGKLEVTEEEVHPYCKEEEEGGEYLVVDDADIDDRMENVSYKSTYTWRPVRKKDPYVYTEPLLLTPEEAFFLSYGLGCLSVMDENETMMTLSDLWLAFCRKPRFLALYAAYHFFRSKGWVPKPGIVFGTDYIVYREGPPFYHGSYSVVVKAVEEGSYEEIEEFSNRKLTWSSFAGLNRVTEHVAKTLMFCYVVIPQSLTEEDRKTPECLKKLKIRLQTVDRWVSSQEREKEKEPEAEKS